MKASPFPFLENVRQEKGFDRVQSLHLITSIEGTLLPLSVLFTSGH